MIIPRDDNRKFVLGDVWNGNPKRIDVNPLLEARTVRDARKLVRETLQYLEVRLAQLELYTAKTKRESKNHSLT